LPKAKRSAGEMGGILDRLEKWLVEHRPEYHRALQPGASSGDLKTLKSQLNRPLPAALRSLLGWHNGQDPDAVGCFEQDRRLMGCSEIAAAAKDLQEASASGKSSDHFDPAWIPFLDDEAGNYVCLDTGRPGAPLREVIPGRSNQQLLAPSLAAWLADFVAAVERGDYVEDPERGSFFRKSKSRA
jgi:cell wall assembly regulator SMI1